MELSELINSLNGLRKEAREQRLNLIAKTFYNYLKRYDYKTFRVSLLNSFFSSEINPRNKQRITKEVLRILESENKINKTKENKTYFCLENKPLSSMDYNSYNMLMKKNGYKSYYYVWEYDEKKKIPIKKNVGQSDINEKVNFFYDVIENRSHKPKNKQGVYSNSCFSVVKRSFEKPIISYEVL